jgi:hypothetical protein
MPSSNFRGVSFHKRLNRWHAYCRDPSAPFSKRQRYIGVYRTEIEAAQAYNRVARELLGSAAVLNQIPDDPPPPEPHEIEAACEAIRAGWSEGDFFDRAPHAAPRNVAIVEVSISDLIAAAG